MSATTTYAITDRIAYLPFGLWSGNVTVMAEFSNRDDGVVTTRRAPLGIVIKERWRVRESGSAVEITQRADASGAARSEGLTLQLDVELDGSWLVLPLVVDMMQKSHENMIEELRRRIVGHGGAATGVAWMRF
jgi:hypothetical protein